MIAIDLKYQKKLGQGTVETALTIALAGLLVITLDLMISGYTAGLPQTKSRAAETEAEFHSKITDPEAARCGSALCMSPDDDRKPPAKKKARKDG